MEIEAIPAASIEILGSAWVDGIHFVLGRLPNGRFWLAWRLDREFSGPELTDLLTNPPDEESDDVSDSELIIGDAQHVRSELAGFAYSLVYTAAESEMEELTRLMQMTT